MVCHDSLHENLKWQISVSFLDWKWLALHFISLVIPLILNMYLIYTTFTMFVPIMGRAGSAVNPDLLIGYKAASMTLATMR